MISKQLITDRFNWLNRTFYKQQNIRSDISESSPTKIADQIPKYKYADQKIFREAKLLKSTELKKSLENWRPLIQISYKNSHVKIDITDICVNCGGQGHQAVSCNFCFTSGCIDPFDFKSASKKNISCKNHPKVSPDNIRPISYTNTKKLEANLKELVKTTMVSAALFASTHKPEQKYIEPIHDFIVAIFRDQPQHIYRLDESYYTEEYSKSRKNYSNKFNPRYSTTSARPYIEPKNVVSNLLCENCGYVGHPPWQCKYCKTCDLVFKEKSCPDCFASQGTKINRGSNVYKSVKKRIEKELDYALSNRQEKIYVIDGQEAKVGFNPYSGVPLPPPPESLPIIPPAGIIQSEPEKEKYCQKCKANSVSVLCMNFGTLGKQWVKQCSRCKMIVGTGCPPAEPVIEISEDKSTNFESKSFDIQIESVESTDLSLESLPHPDKLPSIPFDEPVIDIFESLRVPCTKAKHEDNQILNEMESSTTSWSDYEIIFENIKRSYSCLL